MMEVRARRAGRPSAVPGRRRGPPIDMPEPSAVPRRMQLRVCRMLSQEITEAKSQSGKAVVLELFAGSGRVAKCARRQGVPAIAVDVQRGPQYDLSRGDIIEGIVAHMRAGNIRAVWLGTPCSTWSTARRGHPGAPGGPLRLKGELIWGHPIALRRPADRRKIELGNSTAKCTAKIIQAAVEHKIPVALENGNASRLWHCPPIAEMCQHPSARKLVTDMCRHGAQWRKRTRVQIWVCASSAALRQRCRRTAGSLCVVSGQPHLILQGKRHGGNLSAYASRYPWRFARAAARMLLKSARGGAVAWPPPERRRLSGGGEGGEVA